MGRPALTNKKKINSFRLSNEAQSKIDAVSDRQKSKTVSEAIVKYLSVCDHEFTAVDINGNPPMVSRPNEAMYAMCKKCGHYPTVSDAERGML